jgi:hypothetical protein
MARTSADRPFRNTTSVVGDGCKVNGHHDTVMRAWLRQKGDAEQPPPDYRKTAATNKPPMAPQITSAGAADFISPQPGNNVMPWPVWLAVTMCLTGPKLWVKYSVIITIRPGDQADQR